MSWDRKEHGNRHCREGESSNVSFHLVKGGFWAQGSEG